MMAAFILVCSVVTLLQFFVWYCRSLIAASAKEALSPEVRDVTGIARAASGEDFTRVMQLLQLCPERPEDRGSIQAVGTAHVSFDACLDRIGARQLRLFCRYRS